jgi:putative Mg2+ transporter-C (MgtC) family protein
MPIHPGWSEIAIRLLCAIAAGALIGLDRGEHGRPAGLRTTILVCLAACVAMIQANVLMATAGKSSDSFVVLDLMRLPLGILSGMGFIGAGAIMRRGNLVLGVTTAATLWFVTVLGLCFGGGQIALGLGGLSIGMVVITGLRRFERGLKQDRQGTLTIITTAIGPTEAEIRTILGSRHYEIASCSLVYLAAADNHEIAYRLSWRDTARNTSVPEIVGTLAQRSGVVKIAWAPQVH